MKTLRVRIANWFVRAALWVAALFKPVPKALGNGDDPQTLRVETDVETPLSPGQLAVLLRNIAKDNLHAPTLLSLADGIERGCRRAPAGTRGAIVMAGDAMTMDATTCGEVAELLHLQTRSVTREPGELVEILISVVVASNAKTVDPVPVTSLSFDLTQEGGS